MAAPAYPLTKAAAAAAAAAGHGRGRGRAGRGGTCTFARPAPHRQSQTPQVDNGQGSDCSVCNSVLTLSCKPTLHFNFDVSLKEWSEGPKKKRKEYLSTFLKMVNILFNGGGGFILLHTDQKYLAFFDEQVDDRLMSMIPDGSMFDENFRTKVMDDQHACFQVLPPHNLPKTPFCILDFHSTISLNKGRAKPNYTQMKHLLTRRHSDPPTMNSPFKNKFLVKDKVIPFMENRRLQAKLITEHDMQSMSGTSQGEKLLSLCWERLYLPDFISAFSKQQQGGHYCLGLEEEKKCEGQRWLPVEGAEAICKLVKMEKKLWISKDNTNIVYIADDADVPTYENRTGRYILRGVRLSMSDREYFKTGLNWKLRSRMFWYPNTADNPPPVTFLFHQVLEPEVADENSGAVGGTEDCSERQQNRLIFKDLYVVEVQVGYYPGVCFHDSNGPEAYQYRHRSNPPAHPPVRVPSHECCHRLCT